MAVVDYDVDPAVVGLLLLLLLLLSTAIVLMRMRMGRVVILDLGRIRKRRLATVCRQHMVVVDGSTHLAAFSVGQITQVPVNALERKALARVVTPASQHHPIHVMRAPGRLLQQDSVLQELNYLHQYTLVYATMF